MLRVKIIENTFFPIYLFRACIPAQLKENEPVANNENLQTKPLHLLLHPFIILRKLQRSHNIYRFLLLEINQNKPIIKIMDSNN